MIKLLLIRYKSDFKNIAIKSHYWKHLRAYRSIINKSIFSTTNVFAIKVYIYCTSFSKNSNTALQNESFQRVM